jgi:hypothetical protein
LTASAGGPVVSMMKRVSVNHGLSEKA